MTIQLPSPAPPRVAPVKAALVVTGIGLGVSTGLAITPETAGQFTAAGGVATFAGSLTGLVGTYLALVMVLLVSRIPFVERVLGHDGLLRWHRRLAPWPIWLLVAHAVAITIGYAQAARSGLWHQIGVLLSQYPDMLTATIGLGLICLAAVISVRAVRRRVSTEIWWSVHLLLYLALALSLAHVIALGPAFAGHPLTQAVWWAVWAATAGLVLAYRIGLPLVRSLRYRLRVAEVRQEGPGVVSVIVSGRHLDRLAVSGGQFFYWRFLVRGMWWLAHPYSLSALPHPPYLRLTIKDLGDHSASVARLRPGTKILIEGPYGTFTRYSQQHRSVALVAAGIGVTALRALLEDLPEGSQPTVILRASSSQDLVFGPEIRGLTEHKNGTYHEIFGSRAQAPLDAGALHRLVPDLDRRDVFIVGPDAFVAATTAVARGLGVPAEAIHHEAFVL
ncbi:MAG TPA: ferredoxin reductase family protein [Streptosporangiaceae bacterium]|jgi:predicted ferric reductase